MRKLLSLTLGLILTLSVLFPAYADEKIAVKTQDEIKVVVFKIGDTNYYLEDKESNIQTVTMDVAPYIKNGRTLIPARFLGNALGVSDANIGWDGKTRTATLQGKKKLTLVIGNLTMTSDGVKTQMDVAPEIKSGRTMLLARYVAEGLGYEVGWDAANQVVICWEKGTPQPDINKIMQEIEFNKPVEPKPGLPVHSSAELKKIYKILESKGYKMGLRYYPDCTNDYGTIEVMINKSDPRKDQYDADVYEQVKSFIGVDAAEWVKKGLDACEHPLVTTASIARVYGVKSMAIYLVDGVYNPATGYIDPSDEITVEFDIEANW
jgi:hypothetical protein